MDIRQKFLELTQTIVPMGDELKLLRDLLPDYLKEDPVGNLYVKIGDSDVMFASHLDTVGGNTASKISHLFDGNFIRTNGKTILGADDKAGVVIMLYMIEKQVPGYYFFFLGEERGCIGSGKLTKWMLKNKNNEFSGINKVIAFDRAGYDNIITHQSFQRCCSEEFAEAFIGEMKKFGINYSKDPTGVYCDSAEFADFCSECTNLSVGYFDQHKTHEKQDIVFLEKIAEVFSMVDWNNLPHFRDPSVIEFMDDFYDSSRSRAGDVSNYVRDNYDDESETIQQVDFSKVQLNFFLDKKYSFLSDVSYYNGNIIDMNLSPKRISDELDIFEDYFEENQVQYVEFYWDGFILTIEQKGETHPVKLNRNEIIEFIPELDIKNIDGFVDYDK